MPGAYAPARYAMRRSKYAVAAPQHAFVVWNTGTRNRMSSGFCNTTSSRLIANPTSVSQRTRATLWRGPRGATIEGIGMFPVSDAQSFALQVSAARQHSVEQQLPPQTSYACADRRLPRDAARRAP